MTSLEKRIGFGIRVHALLLVAVCCRLLCHELNLQNQAPLLQDFSASIPPSAKVSVNPRTAGLDEWMWLPGVGPNLAKAIVSCRPFLGVPLTAENLHLIPGVGEKLVAKWIACGGIEGKR